MSTREILLITGGAASGKSAWALQHGETIGRRRIFIATAEARDDEMQRRISAHRSERAQRWNTVEEPRELPCAVAAAAENADVVLVDCLTMWISNLLTIYRLDRGAVASACEQLVAVLQEAGASVLLVTNEVGAGIIPADSLSRAYQRVLGRLNRDVAAAATGVYCMVAGIPWKIK